MINFRLSIQPSATNMLLIFMGYQPGKPEIIKESN